MHFFHFVGIFLFIVFSYYFFCVSMVSVTTFPLPFLLPSFLPFFFSFVFLGLHLQHMEVPRLGVESELQLLACGMATATPDPVSIYDLHCSLQQHWIFNSLHEARDHTYILMDTSWVLNLLSHNRNSSTSIYCFCFFFLGPIFFLLVSLAWS